MYEKKSGKAGASVVEKFRKFSDTFWVCFESCDYRERQ
jgi:hypothetical protein